MRAFGYAVLAALWLAPSSGTVAHPPVGTHPECSPDEHEWTVGIIYEMPEAAGEVRRIKAYVCSEEEAEAEREWINSHGFYVGEYTSVSSSLVRAFTLYQSDTFPPP